MITNYSEVLEFGPASGELTKYLCEVKHCKVDIVEINSELGNLASRYSRHALVGEEKGNIEKYDWMKEFEGNQYDHILFVDVLEHLYNPWQVLKCAKQYLKQNGSVIISMPNIAHNSIIFNLLKDDFPYAPWGLLDYTHIRFFTIYTFEKMIREAGLVVVKRNATYRHFKLKESEEEIFDRLDFDIVKAHLLGNVFQFVYEIKQSDFYPDTYQSIESFCHENSFLKTKLYWTDEKDFSDKKTIISDLHIDGDGHFSVSFNLENIENIRRLRFDPVENMKISLHINSIMIDDERSEIIKTNSGLSYKNEYVFFTKDPQVEFVLPRKKFVKVKIDGFIFFGKKYYNELLKHVEKLQHDKGEVERELTVSQTHIERLQHDKGEVERELSVSKQEIKRVSRELHNIRSGYSFKVGRIITFIPRKIKRLFRL